MPPPARVPLAVLQNVALRSAATSRPVCLVRAVPALQHHRSLASSSRSLLPHPSPISLAEDSSPSTPSEEDADADLDLEFEDVDSPGGRGQKNKRRGRKKRSKRTIHISFKRWQEENARSWLLPPEEGPNWLGMTIPYGAKGHGCVFPNNPSFRPPTPLSDSDRAHLFQQYQLSPSDATIRRLSMQHAISLDRVRAIIKLKEHEEEWKRKVHLQEQNANQSTLLNPKHLHPPLQTALQIGMEKYIGIRPRLRLSPSQSISAAAAASDSYVPASYEGRRLGASQEQYTLDSDSAWAREKAVQSDTATRIIWELVEEGGRSLITPQMEKITERRRQKMAKSRRKAEDLPTVRIPPTERVFTALAQAAPGEAASAGAAEGEGEAGRMKVGGRARPGWVFVDVGEKWASERGREVQSRAQAWRGVGRRQEREMNRARV